ncbi:hypothetical protein SAY87_008271 [Trapa incisa]|uniref:Sugar phosphate transporter domain-containing protein n=1 Tax=Trapa incisa TaxID=236973 RepID=A0AAN7KFS8_9MYRT|nr:hypothetical protein SAY87_008271 [Trapa incisa]
MQSSMFTFSPTIPFPKSPSLRTRLSAGNRTSTFNFDTIRISASSSNSSPPLTLSSSGSDAALCSASSRRSWSRFSSSPSSMLRPWSGFQHSGSDPHTPSFEVLKAYHYPATITLAQFAVGSVLVLFMAGFWSAMASNLTNQSRNVLSKKVMVKKEESLDNITLFSIITMMSFVLLFPVTCYLEGVKFSPAFFKLAAEQGMNVKQLLTRSFLAALCFHAYQQVSYMILQRVSPVTHSVGNCVKRVVVIVSSVIFFQTPVSPINSLGTGVALAGVFLYSRVKRIKPKAKAA